MDDIPGRYMTTTGETTRGPGRPKGATAKPADVAISEKLDRELLKQLRGTPAFDPATGRPILDAKGRPVLRPPSASLLNVAAKRVGDIRDGRTLTPSERQQQLARQFEPPYRPAPLEART